jgi:crotonobetainyl-CoA:carnitine CoA-transferase CaiB-like acyl-CoA transferase/3-hydroxyisobutyrate dehydrogenase-like beta-hydroxyacid dehydrogenase
MSDRPLAGTLVLDLSQFMAGPGAALRLADLGASVIKVERPGTGDSARQLYASNLILDGDSTLFHTVNRNKQSLAADLKNPDDLARLKRLISQVDVLIQNFRPGVMDRLGLSYDAVRQLNPKLIYASVTGYGTNGPWTTKPGQDLLAQALSGISWLNGNRNDPPIPCGLSIIDIFAAAHLTQGILACLTRRGVTGKGGLVEVSLLESALDIQFELVTTFLNDGGQLPDRSASNNGNAYLAAPYGFYKTADGYLALAMTSIPQLGELLGLPGLLEFKSNQSWFSERDTIKRTLADHLATRPTESWLEILEPAGVWCAEVLDWRRLVQHPAFEALKMTQVIGPASPRELLTTRCPIRIDQEILTNPTPAPRIGEHNEQINEQYQLGQFGPRTTDLSHVGVIGMGTMGSPMARSLLRAGMKVTVYNRTAARCESAVTSGATVAGTPAQLAESCDVVFLMLSDDAAVEQAVCGKDGVLSSGRPGLTVINSSTVHPDTNRRLSEALAGRDMTLLEAPVTGSKVQAETGQLYFLVGGDETTYRKCVPALDAMGRGHIHLGPIGAASCVKLANNLMGFVNMLGLVEALEIVKACGVSPDKFLEAVSNSGSRSAVSEIKGPKILREDWTPDFSLRLSAKDLRLARRLAEELLNSAPLATAAATIYSNAADHFGEDDACAIAKSYHRDK